jgi:hypothetical protein
MKFFKEIYALLWTLAGTALVLITLSGSVKVMAMWISGITLLVHLVGSLFTGDDADDTDDN